MDRLKSEFQLSVFVDLVLSKLNISLILARSSSEVVSSKLSLMCLSSTFAKFSLAASAFSWISSALATSIVNVSKYISFNTLNPEPLKSEAICFVSAFTREAIFLKPSGP